MTLRSLKHLEWPTTGVKAASRIPRIFKQESRWVPVRNRVIFWNIVPGDYVRQNQGKLLSRLSLPGVQDPSRSELRVRGEGLVDQIDRVHNKVFLRVEEDPDNPSLHKLAPFLKRQNTSRRVDPSGDKGFGPNWTKVARALHYSNLQVRIPNEVLPEEVVKAAKGQPIYAIKMKKRHVGYDRFAGHFAWERIATYKHPETKQKHKIKLPWPKRQRKAREFKKFTTGRNEVLEESWIPWDPRDPILALPEMNTITGRVWSTPESEISAARARIFWEAYKQAVARAAKVETEHPRLAEAYIGFKKDNDWARRLIARPPPSAQQPLPAEKVNLRNKALAAWAADPVRRDHVEVEGGRSFAPQDYLYLAPLTGPLSQTHWTGFDAAGWSTPGESRQLPTGMLLQRPSKAQLDAFPLELLMHRELTGRPVMHPNHRLRRGKQLLRQEQAEQAELEQLEEEEDMGVEGQEDEWVDEEDVQEEDVSEPKPNVPRFRNGKPVPAFTPQEQRMNSLRNLRL